MTVIVVGIVILVIGFVAAKLMSHLPELQIND